MLAEKVNLIGVLDVNELYEKAVAGIEIILKRRYKMTVADAKNAIAISPLKDLFKEDAEMAAHTSNESWAREIYEFWNKRQEK